MQKYLICGALALGALTVTSGANANSVIINGQPYAGGSHTVSYPPATAGSAHCCGQTYDTGTVVSAPVTTHYETAPVTDSGLVYVDQPAVQPATYAVPVATVPAKPMKKHHGKRHGWGSQVYVGVRGGWTRADDTSFALNGGSVENDYDNKGYPCRALSGGAVACIRRSACGWSLRAGIRALKSTRMCSARTRSAATTRSAIRTCSTASRTPISTCRSPTGLALSSAAASVSAVSSSTATASMAGPET